MSPTSKSLHPSLTHLHSPSLKSTVQKETKPNQSLQTYMTNNVLHLIDSYSNLRETQDITIDKCDIVRDHYYECTVFFIMLNSYFFVYPTL